MKSPLEMLDRAKQKRDKWTVRVEEVEAACRAVATESTAPDVEARKFAFRLPPILLKELVKGGLYCGAMTSAAKMGGVSVSYVKAVAHGESSSFRVMGNLLLAIGEIKDTRPEAVDSLTDSEYDFFRRGGKYYGLTAKVAKTLGVSLSTAGKVAAGKAKSRRVLIALREAMNEVDKKHSQIKGAL